MPEGAVYVGRPTMWGNPFGIGAKCPITVGSAAEAVECFERLIDVEKWDVSSLRGKNLACWCKIGAPCHGDALLRIANGPLTCDDATPAREGAP